MFGHCVVRIGVLGCYDGGFGVGVCVLGNGVIAGEFVFEYLSVRMGVWDPECYDWCCD